MTAVYEIDASNSANSARGYLGASKLGMRCAGLNVLLVEDDEADAYLIQRALSSNPRIDSVTVAQDGVEALDMIDTRVVKPDLAIIDLHMPRKDGFALLRDFSLRVTVEFPSIVLTSSRAGADALRAKKRGAEFFLTKPNSFEKLALSLDQVIAEI
jgi:CheY-like chemotaxis protein